MTDHLLQSPAERKAVLKNELHKWLKLSHPDRNNNSRESNDFTRRLIVLDHMIDAAYKKLTEKR